MSKSVGEIQISKMSKSARENSNSPISVASITNSYILCALEKPGYYYVIDLGNVKHIGMQCNPIYGFSAIATEE